MPIVKFINRHWWCVPLTFALWLALVAAVGAQSARADVPPVLPAEAIERGGLFLPAPAGAAGGIVAAPLLGTEIQVDVSGITARTRVTHRFVNPMRSWAEAIYTHPLPMDSAVDRLRMRIGDRLVEGRIKERAQARRDYMAAKRSGHRAALIEQQRPNLFTTAVANLAPGQRISVTIEYQERLDFRDGQFTLRLPLVAGPRYIPGAKRPAGLGSAAGAGEDPGMIPGGGTATVPGADAITPPLRAAGAGMGNPVVLTVNLAAGFETGRIESPSHAIRIADKGAGRSLIRLAGDAVPADRDFVLRWAPAKGALPKAGFFWETVGGDDYGLLVVMPPVTGGAGIDLKPIPRDVTFVIDISGSMHGRSLDQAKQALGRALDRLTPDDRFRVIGFSHELRLFAPGPLAADPATLARAKAFIQGLEAQGGTEIVRAMAVALDSPPQAAADGSTKDTRSERLRQVVLMTDGAVGDELRLLDLIDKRLGDRRLFTVGIGSVPNGYLMSRAARAGRGSHTFIQAETEIAERMAELFLKLERPALTDLTLDWPGAGGEAAEVWPRPLPDLYAGEPVVALIKLNGAGPRVRLAGQLGGRPWRQEVAITGGSASPGVATLWGREKIRQLMIEMRLVENREKVRARIVETALALNLVSQYTSLVAVEATPARPVGAGLVSDEVPVNLPAGWSRRPLTGEGASPTLPKAPAAPGPQRTRLDQPNAPATAATRDARLRAQPAVLTFDRGDGPIGPHLAAAVSGTPLMAMPQTATPAQAFMAFGLLLVLAALSLFTLRRRRRARADRGGGR